MSNDRPPLDERVDQLERQVRSLTRAVERLAGQLSDIESLSASESPSRNPVRSQYHEGEPDSGSPGEFGDPIPVAATAVSDDLISWAGRASVLTRISALCFLLVVALGLRTITDYGLIDKQVGLVIGMSYASLLMFAGWYLYRIPNAVAPVFAACGIVLLTAIVVETHAHFGSLSSASAYLLLTLTGISMAAVSRQFNRFLPVSLGIMGMCLGGIIIDFPSPQFASLAMVLLVANGLGYAAAGIRRCSWLRWTVLAITMGTMYIWAYELRFALVNRHEMLPRLTPSLFLPVLAMISLFYTVAAFLGVVRNKRPYFSRFDLAVPTVNAAWAFLTAWYVVSALGDSRDLLGAAGVIYAGGLMGLAAWLAGREKRFMPAASAFTFAAAVLAAVAFPVAIRNYLVALPLLSLAAAGLILLAHRWDSTGARVASYLLQIYASVCLSVFLWRNARFSVSPMSAIAAAAPACIGFLHYRWSRAARPMDRGERWRTDDHGPSFLLVASLISAFFMLRVGVYQALRLFPVDLDNSFACAQSILINASAAALMLFAWLRRNREVRNVAILVTVIGGVKVFTDMLGTHGVPLVISVFSFGLAAAFESTALGRWGSRHEPRAPRPVKPDVLPGDVLRNSSPQG